MSSPIRDLAKLLAKAELEDFHHIKFSPIFPISVMRELESEGFCRLETYTMKTASGRAELRWNAYLEEK